MISINDNNKNSVASCENEFSMLTGERKKNILHWQGQISTYCLCYIIGRQYDKHGNLQEWWEPSIIDNFKEKAKCIVDQYSNFVVPEANLNVSGLLKK